MQFCPVVLLISIIASASCLPAAKVSPKDAPMTQIPAADGLLHVYALPIGQGDARVIQCPSGTLTIFDLGSSDDISAGFWFSGEIRNFFSGSYHLVKNIILTHNHYDHYRFLYDVFLPTDDLSGLTDIYISCLYENMVTDIQTWVNDIGAFDKLRPFNGGSTCGSSAGGNPDCGTIDLCPGDSGITAQVLSVNAGLQCAGDNKNIDSVVIGITYNNFKLQLNGDFEDFTNDPNESGPQKAMADFYGSELQVDVYMIAHHGAENLANKPVIRNVVTPKAVFVSSNPWYSNYRHPRCSITDAFINDVQSLCKPGDTDPTSPLYCGEHPIANLPLADKVQSTYTCGPEAGGLMTIYDNDYAIYSTTPDATQMNLIHLLTDGTLWGFVNNIQPKIVRNVATPVAKAPEADLCFEN